jgi:hypothetical protein
MGGPPNSESEIKENAPNFLKGSARFCFQAMVLHLGEQGGR